MYTTQKIVSNTNHVHPDIKAFSLNETLDLPNATINDSNNGTFIKMPRISINEYLAEVMRENDIEK